jgi:flagellar FliL protein
MSSDSKPSKTEDAGAEGAPAKKKMAGKTLVLFIALPVLLLGGGGAAAMVLLGGKDKPAAEGDAHAGDTKKASEKDAKGKDAKDDHGKDAKSKDAKGKDAKGKDASAGDVPAIDLGTLRIGEAGMPSYYTLPDVIVNLSSIEGTGSLLKLKLTLEASDASAFDALQPLMPRVLDQFQSFLREMRVEDLNGSASQVRLRLELLRRVNLAIAPGTVDAVLVEEMLVQ